MPNNISQQFSNCSQTVSLAFTALRACNHSMLSRRRWLRDTSKLRAIFAMCFVGSLVIAPTGIAQEPRTQTPSVIVDPVTLTEVSERVQTGLNIGAAVNHQNVANGIQKAADVWGLHVDLFVQADSGKAAALL